MTTTTSPLLHEGQVLTLKHNISGQYIGGYYGHTTIPSDTEVVIQKVGKQSIWVRGVEQNYPNMARTLPIYVDPSDNEALDTYFNEVDPNAPRPRRIGEAPEGAISVDDPRIAWIWEDAARVATKSGHCSEYDKLCDELGAPGRERSFTVKRNVNGFDVSKKFKARSKKLAEAMFDAELPSVVNA